MVTVRKRFNLDDEGEDGKETIITIVRLEHEISSFNCWYGQLYRKDDEATELLRLLEETLIYNSAEESQICIAGRKLKIPRRQVAHGNNGLKYSFSGLHLACKPWIPELDEIRKRVSRVDKCTFNLLLI